MNRRRTRFAPALSIVNEVLESRIALSGIAAASGLQDGAAQVRANTAQRANTQTTLVVSAGTLGQPLAVTVTVRGASTAGPPQGTVNLTDHGKVIQTLTLVPATSTDPRYAFSQATATLNQVPGGSDYFFGKHTFQAEFTPAAGFLKSRASASFTVSQPQYSTLAGGVQVATIAQGSGPAIQSGQTANVLYTGYLARNGHIFDESNFHGGTPLSFTLGSGSVIPGFDTGTIGMRAGETRVVMIPPAQAYGARANGPIPGNSTLIFVLTLQSIS